MRAVNLIPDDTGRNRTAGIGSLPQGPAVVVLGVLAIALALVTVYVLTQNTINGRKATLARAQTQLASVKTQAAQLSQYAQFAQLAQARVQTIRQIATTRFNWYAALSDLSKVVPADTSLQSLVGTVSPDVTVTAVGASGSGGSGLAGTLRGAINAPAFVLVGCTKTQDDVARLMSRLRVMDGVTRVTLAGSAKQAAAQTGAAVGSGPTVGCGANAPSFDLVVFFAPLPGAASTGVSTSSAAVATSTPATTTPATTTPATTTPATTTPATTTPPTTTPATTTPATTTPASTGGSK